MRTKVLLLITVMAAACAAFADVKDSGANGFTISTTFTVKGTPDEVYRKIVNVGEWWSSEHTYSGDAHNLTIDARAGGCWCERLPKVNGSVHHMEVATAWPGMMLVMTGGLGPLQQMGASGAMTFKLSPAQGGTKVEFIYVASGYAPPGMSALAPAVDQVLMGGMTRLRSYIDTGVAADTKK